MSAYLSGAYYHYSGFAGVWTPATHAELNSNRTIHVPGSGRALGSGDGADNSSGPSLDSQTTSLSSSVVVQGLSGILMNIRTERRRRDGRACLIGLRVVSLVAQVMEQPYYNRRSTIRTAVQQLFQVIHRTH